MSQYLDIHNQFVYYMSMYDRNGRELQIGDYVKTRGRAVGGVGRFTTGVIGDIDYSESIRNSITVIYGRTSSGELLLAASEGASILRLDTVDIGMKLSLSRARHLFNSMRKDLVGI